MNTDLLTDKSQKVVLGVLMVFLLASGLAAFTNDTPNKLIPLLFVFIWCIPPVLGLAGTMKPRTALVTVSYLLVPLGYYLVYLNGILPVALVPLVSLLPLLFVSGRQGYVLSALLASGTLLMVFTHPSEINGVWIRVTITAVCTPILFAYVLNKVRQVNSELMKASNAKSDFLANMSHEIRTPLNGIFGSLQVIRSHLNDPATVSRYTNVAMQSYHSVIGIVNDILDLSKLAEDKVELYPEPSNVREIVDLVTAELKAVSLKKGLELSCYCDAQIDAKNRLIDRTRLTQVLRNFLSNAVKFTSSGAVTLEARLGGSSAEVVFVVSDTGVGIPQDRLETIFEPFEQSDSSRNTERSGTGLGLAISKKLVELMGGTITVSSTVAKGSRFEIRVELPETSIERTDKRGAIDIAKLQPARILVAEDVATNRMIFGALLKGCPYTIEEAENGEIAVEKALTQDYDLIFMDIQMPLMDGLSALHALKTANYAKPIIACTANVMKEDIEDYMKAGFDGIIGKPYLKEELVANIQAAVTSENFARDHR